MGVTLAFGFALFLPGVAAAIESPADFGGRLLVALMTALIWENGFAAIRRKPFSFHGVTTAIVVAVLCPDGLAVWQLVLAMSLGVVLGELVFGGRGFGILNAAVVTLALLVFSFPQIDLPAASPALAMATLPGALALLALGLISWRVILAAVLAVVAVLAMGGHQVDLPGTVSALAFGLIFLICDPVAAASTYKGRWIYGALAGTLIVLLSPDAMLGAPSLIYAALIASLFAPLIDHLVVLDHARRRRARHA